MKYKDIKLENFGIVSAKEMTLRELQRKTSENLIAIQKILADIMMRLEKLEKIDSVR